MSYQNVKTLNGKLLARIWNENPNHPYSYGFDYNAAGEFTGEFISPGKSLIAKLEPVNH